MNDLPPTPISDHAGGHIPSDAECRVWWDEYGMYDHIKMHSELVAAVATSLAEMAADKGLGNPDGLSRDDFVQSVRAAGLLHDLGKTWSIVHGGNHSQLGAAWTMELTRNPRIAQGVVHHVHWPGELDAENFFLPLAVIYADKRVKHDKIVNLHERFEDLFARYGHTERSRALVRRAHDQGKAIEHLFSTILGEEIHEYPFDRRRLVR
ncbi:HD domain-containing protein [Desulfomicrobium salsuginis]